MPKPAPFCDLAVIAACLLLAQPSIAETGIRGNLADVHWLEKHRNDPHVVILDASPAAAYKANHIPGAISVDLFAYGLPEAPVAIMQKRFQSWGVGPEKTVVLYDQGGSMMATRVFFSLYYHGFPAEKLLMLDGGLYKWQNEGLPVTKDSTPPPIPGSFVITNRHEDENVLLPEFLNASGDPANNALVEALGPDWHFGEVMAFDRAGHIPHAILLPSADFYNSDRTFKSPDEVQRMVTYLGIRPEQRIYTLCGGGVAASVPYYALKFILNYPNVKLYTGSELEWLSDERELPYWTYDAPHLMRASNWLQFQAANMPRAIGITHVSIVDVRPNGAFEQGHVPFARSVPADTFRSNLATPGKLAEILGAAGVNASDEAVVISGGGLNRESALAFLMLEKLGQKKVSVFTDSIEQWSQGGFPVSKEAMALAPAPYPAAFRDGVIITDPKSTYGVFPKVFIASGSNVPEHAPEGQLVHVPSTELLTGDGTPKAAKDIWKILNEAGVPRYAELVCYADDPGDSAIAYYILKLMGYPDIKVLVR